MDGPFEGLEVLRIHPSASQICLAGPPACGKTAPAKRIAGTMRRPAVTVALGGVWDESAIRGLPISFRSPEAGGSCAGCGARRSATP